MSEFKAGDHVHIEFIADGTVTYVHSAGLGVEVYVDNVKYFVPVSALSKARPALPTKEGSVIRITKWAASEENWTAILTVSGWRVSADHNHLYRPNSFLDSEDEFEVIYVPEN